MESEKPQRSPFELAKIVGVYDRESLQEVPEQTGYMPNTRTGDTLNLTVFVPSDVTPDEKQLTFRKGFTYAVLDAIQYPLQDLGVAFLYESNTVDDDGLYVFAEDTMHQYTNRVEPHFFVEPHREFIPGEDGQK